MAKRPTSGSSRSTARLAAVQALYQIEFSGGDPEQVIDEFTAHRLGEGVDGIRFVKADAALFGKIVRGVMRGRGELDDMIAAVLVEDWTVERLETLLACILRAGAHELADRADVPARVVISEYVDLADAFYGEKETGLVNGVLDRLARELRPLELGMASGFGKRPDEFELIARHFRPLAAGQPGALGLADDAALIDVPEGRRLVVTTDLLTAGVHFLPDDPAALVARKALRVNLSDLAAMAAMPLAYVLACAFPSTIEEAWIADFAAGLARDQAEFGIALMGGDTTATLGSLTISVTALGTVEPGREIRRSGAKAGDLVAVSGTIGDAVLGLARLQGRIASLPEDEFLIERYRLPQPRLALAQRLAGLASAGMDISDGLIADLGHICEASGLAAVVEAGRVPLSGPAQKLLRSEPGRLRDLLIGGDDYELLFTLPAHRQAELAGLPVTIIGRTEAGQGVRLLDPEGHLMDIGRGGFQHF